MRLIDRINSRVRDIPPEHRGRVRGAIKELRGAGISLTMILSLLVKYGPQLWEVLKAFLEAFKAKKSLKRWTE